MRKIAVMEDFLTPERRKKVLDTAEKYGFAVDFYGRGAAPAVVPKAPEPGPGATPLEFVRPMYEEKRDCKTD